MQSFPAGNRPILTFAVWVENGKAVPKHIIDKICYIRSDVRPDNTIAISYLKTGAVSGTVHVKYLKKI